MNAVSPKRTDAAAAYRNAPRHELREFQPICTTDTPVACQFGSAIFANLTHEDGVNIGMASGTQLMARRLLTEVMTMGTASDAEVGAARVHPFADDICTLDDDTFLLRASFV